MAKRARRSSRKNKKNHYFTHVHEEAILEYVATIDLDKRNVLYRDLIGPAFNEMVEKIIFTYKFTTLQNVDCLKEECVIWLTTILDKYDVNKGSKAFSYFSVITKNWFIQKSKKQSKRVKKEITIDDIVKECDVEYVTTHNKYNEEREQWEFWRLLMSEINSWGEMEMKPNERKVLLAVQILLENPDDIPIFNKKAIYLYLREITGLNTKQIVNYLNKMREKYRRFKADWDDGGI